MKKKISIILILMFLTGLIGGRASGYEKWNYNHKLLENYMTYRIKYIHNNAYNSNSTLTKSRAREYAREILNWSDYYSRELGVDISPLLILSHAETETNFVSRADYDNGGSIGIVSMSKEKAKELCKREGIRYADWKMIDATELGIRLPVLDIGLNLKLYQNLSKAILAYNQGKYGVKDKSPEDLYRVKGRYKDYQDIIKNYSSEFFKYKLSQLNT